MYLVNLPGFSTELCMNFFSPAPCIFLNFTLIFSVKDTSTDVSLRTVSSRIITFLSVMQRNSPNRILASFFVEVSRSQFLSLTHTHARTLGLL